MSKNSLNISTNVMTRIQTGKVRMKPRWYFVLGSIGLVMGLSSLAIVSAFLVSLISFSLRTHGPMGDIRYHQLLASFPWWAPVIALVGIIAGVILLKQFDFSYKKNFLMIVVVFIMSIIVTGLAIDLLGIDSYWAREKKLRGLYQHYPGNYQPQGQGRGRM